MVKAGYAFASRLRVNDTSKRIGPQPRSRGVLLLVSRPHSDRLFLGASPHRSENSTGGIDTSLALPRCSYPRVLPSHRYVVVVAAKSDVSTSAKTDLQSLMLAHRQGDCHSDARVPLKRKSVFNAVEAGRASCPEISIERCPESRLYVVNEMSLE